MIETESNEHALITGPMHDDLFNGKFNRVPVMMGITSEEILCKFLVRSVNTY